MKLEYGAGKRKGFTLVEILIVVIIIGILAGALMLALGSSTDKAEATKIAQDMKTLSKAVLSSFADNGDWPTGTSELEKYLDRSICELGRVCYGLENLEDALYVKASLGEEISVTVKDRLSAMARGTGFTQWSGETMEVYQNGDSLYLLVRRSILSGGNNNALFSVDFRSPEDLELFTKIFGSSSRYWNIEEGHLTSDPGSGEMRYSFGDISWEDYILNVTASYGQSSSAGYGIYYRADGDKNITGYIFQYDPGLGNDFVIREVLNGRESSPIQRVDMKAVMGESFQIFDTPHDISISVEGDHHVVTVDGVEVFNFVDDTFNQGSAGLRTWGTGGVATFDEISVENR